MPRYALKVEYDGAPYCGWQFQDGQPSVQATLEGALSKLNKAPLRVAAAGRTDTGVHATGQVAHADMDQPWDPFRLMEALNAHLRPAPIAITATAEVDSEWHARFSAESRCYRYRILTRRAPPVLCRGQVWPIKHTLDVVQMQHAANALIGKHDFTTFRASQCQAASPVKTLDRLEVSAVDGLAGPEIHIIAQARSFLHNQVRSIVGSLVQVGLGRWPATQMREALEAKSRQACGPVAPAGGLCLIHVGYSPDPLKN